MPGTGSKAAISAAGMLRHPHPAQAGALPWMRALTAPAPKMEHKKIALQYLCTCGPDAGVGIGSRAVHAHVRLHHVLHHKGLLQDGPVHNLGLHRQLHLDAPAVRLRPHKARIHKLHLQYIAHGCAPRCFIHRQLCTNSNCSTTMLKSQHERAGTAENYQHCRISDHSARAGIVQLTAGKALVEYYAAFGFAIGHLRQTSHTLPAAQCKARGASQDADWPGL